MNAGERLALRMIASAALTACAVIANAQCPPDTVEILRERVGDRLRVYCGTGGQANELRDVDAKLQRIDETMRHDRQAIERWNEDLPGYLAAFDEWLALDADAQQKMIERAEHLGATLLLTRLQITSRNAVALKGQEIDVLQQAIRATPLGSSEMKALLGAYGKTSGDLTALRTTAELWEFLDAASSVTAAVGSARRQEYLRAIIEVGGLALHDSRLKILVSESDFTIAALYAKATDSMARRKVDELLALGGARLRAVNALSATYARHVRARNDLRSRRAAILEGN